LGLLFEFHLSLSVCLAEWHTTRDYGYVETCSLIPLQQCTKASFERNRNLGSAFICGGIEWQEKLESN
jgi:hypothetical protein